MLYGIACMAAVVTLACGNDKGRGPLPTHPTSTPTEQPTHEPFLTVLYPNLSSDRLERGLSYDFRWKAEGIPLSHPLEMMLERPDGTVVLRGTLLNNLEQKASVTIPNSIENGLYLLHIRAEFNGKTYFDKSDQPFPIESQRLPEPPQERTVAAGADIAMPESIHGAHATADIIERRRPDAVITAGDHAYYDGTQREFETYYTPTWGRPFILARTRPAPGNHDRPEGYYFTYFGSNAGPAGLGYYIWDLGNWTMISLNSSISAGKSSPQYQQLRGDLSKIPITRCTLAYWHHPPSSNTNDRDQQIMVDIWELLYEFGVDVVVTGHYHNYKRFLPLDARFRHDSNYGIQMFTVGTGGALRRPIREVPIDNMAVGDDNTWGILLLTLRSGGYSFNFIPASGLPSDVSGSFTDSGSGTCHPKPTIGIGIYNQRNDILQTPQDIIHQDFSKQELINKFRTAGKNMHF